MPTVTATNGQEFHLFQATCQIKEYGEGIGFSVFRNDLGDGFRTRTLYGASTGQRRFTLSMPTLQGGSAATLVGIDEAVVTQEQYVWDLYCEAQATGLPFVIRSPRNGQNYLVEFADERLTFQRALSKLYSTGLELVQVRLPGVSVFDVSLMPGSFAHFDETSHGSGEWEDKESANVLAVTGDITFGAAQQAGKDIVRLNSSANTGRFDASDPLGAADVVLVMKMREASFSNNAGILSDTGNGSSLLRGDSATGIFANLGFTGDRYSLNGLETDTDEMTAPMNAWGVVHVRLPAGFSLDRIGQDLAAAGTFAEMDLGELVAFQAHGPMSEIRELIEHLITKWNIAYNAALFDEFEDMLLDGELALGDGEQLTLPDD